MTSSKLCASLVCLLLAACSAEKEPDFCRNHARFHADHSAGSAQLAVEMSATGDIRTELRLPSASMDQESTLSALLEPANVYSLRSEKQCAAAVVSVNSAPDHVFANYASRCGADNKLGQLDVRLFDSLPGLDEVEVKVVTPATQKHFVIHRQCESAIFRFE